MKIFWYDGIHVEFTVSKNYYVRNNDLYYCEQYHDYLLRLDPYWFNQWNEYYDGFTTKGYTILGVTFMKCETYNSDQIDDWEY